MPLVTFTIKKNEENGLYFLIDKKTGLYLRHKNGIVFLDSYSQDPQFLLDSCFIIQEQEKDNEKRCSIHPSNSNLTSCSLICIEKEYLIISNEFIPSLFILNSDNTISIYLKITGKYDTYLNYYNYISNVSNIFNIYTKKHCKSFVKQFISNFILSYGKSALLVSFILKKQVKIGSGLFICSFNKDITKFFSHHYFLKKIRFSFLKEKRKTFKLVNMAVNSIVWKICPTLQLYCINALIYIEKLDIAKELLIDYISNYGFSNIELYMSIAKLATQLNFHNEYIDKSAFIYEKFSKFNQDKFRQFIANSNDVAVVGNGPYELNKNKGSIIDSCEIVVKFNAFDQSEKFNKDYGSRVDVWVRGHGEALDAYINTSIKPKYIVWIGDFKKVRFLSRKQIDIIFNDCQKENIFVGNFAPNLYPKLEYKFQLAPTSGFYFLNFLNEINFSKVKIYGFSFLYDNPKLNHYYDDRNIAKIHSMRDEIDISKIFFNI